ncbi:MAG: C39 family peptidase, partial [Armatimonadetes bacterium]|nr:C39 family peptidase [Armatimonadota bacterium]
MSFEIGLRPDALSFWANDNTVTTSRRHRRETEAEAPGDGVDLSPTANGDLDGRRIDPEAIHITQFRNSRYNPQGLSRSFDCGPTSLAMALRALGLQAPGVGSDFQNSDQGEIDAARYAMFSNSDGRTVDAARDGITGARNADGSFARDKGEHQTTSTWVDDIKRGARNSGAETYAVHSTQDIADAVSKGDPVVLAGDPRRNGSYGDKYNIGYSGRGDHFITVSGYDPATRTFTINDPLSRRGPLQVTWEQLDTFRDKGVALHRTGGRQREQAPTPANDPTPDTNPTGEPDRHHHRRHVEHPHHQTDRKEETIGQTG